MKTFVDSCKRHPWMAGLQAVTVAALTFVGTQLWNMNREIGELKVRVEVLAAQVNRMQFWQDRNLPPSRGFPSSMEETPREEPLPNVSRIRRR